MESLLSRVVSKLWHKSWCETTASYKLSVRLYNRLYMMEELCRLREMFRMIECKFTFFFIWSHLMFNCVLQLVHRTVMFVPLVRIARVAIAATTWTPLVKVSNFLEQGQTCFCWFCSAVISRCNSLPISLLTEQCQILANQLRQVCFLHFEMLFPNFPTCQLQLYSVTYFASELELLQFINCWIATL